MMKITFILLLSLFLISTVISQTFIFQFQESNLSKWGYANIDGKILFESKFSICSEFNTDGSALFLKRNNFFIIDLLGEKVPAEIDDIQLKINHFGGMATGNQVTTFQKESESSYNMGIQGFSDGFLVVKVKNKWGCLSSDGKITIPIIYDRITDFKSGYAFAELRGKFYVLDKEASEFPVNVTDIIEIKHFSEGMGLFQVKGGKWGFVNEKGMVVIEPQFKGTGYFSAGLAWARAKNKDIGYINKNGEWVIDPQFKGAWDFDSISGMAKVRLGNHKRYVDTKGNIYDFENINSRLLYGFSEGLAVAVKGDKYGYIDNTGQWVIQPHYSDARSFRNGFAAANSKNRWGIIDKEGNWVVQPTYYDIGNVTIVK